ncbi:helix-turn-helix domain-containing protein [Salmonella enterica]
MDIQSAICECDIAHAILIAMWSYKKTPSPNESILQSLTFAVESSLDRAKNVFSHKKNDAIQPYFTPYRADLPAPTGYTPNNLGNRIQIAREKLGLSEVDLAEKLDIHPGYVLTWEDGTDQPLAGMIIPLANALRCDPMWLLTGENSNRQSPATPVHQSRSQYSAQQRSAASDHASHHVKHQSQA